MSTPMADLIRLEIDASDAANQITNHSGQGGTTAGWTRVFGEASTFAAVSGLSGHYGGKAIKCNTSTTWNFGIQSTTVPCSPGEWVSFQFNLSSTAPMDVVRVQVIFIGASGGATTSYSPTSGAEATYKLTDPVQAPAGTTGVQFYVRAWRDAGPVATVYFSKAMGVKTLNKSLVLDVPFSDGPVWQNILGSAYNLNFKRGNEIDGVTEKPVIGTLSATLSDPLIDPSKNPRMRPGRRIRVLSNYGSGYGTIWQGKITTLDVNYKGDKPLIALTAVDTWSEVMNLPVPAATTGNLKQRIDEILLGKGIPYTVNAPAATESFYTLDVQDNATALDQIEWATIAKNGFTFVNESGAVEVWSYAQWNATMMYALTFSDNLADAGSGTTFYTDIDTNFGSQALTNSLMVNIHNSFEEDGAKSYGPYTNAASVTNWGTRSATVETTDGEPAVLAANYLKTYANPEIFASSVKFDGRKVGHPLALYQLYNKANVKHAASGLDTTYRILNIEHDISPDRWDVTLGFKPLEATAAVVVTNPPGGPNSGPGDLVVPLLGPLGSRNRTTTFNVNHSAWTTVPLNEAVATDQITWDSTNNRFVIPKDGRYAISAAVRFNTNATGARGVSLIVNGVSIGWNLGAASSIGVGPSVTRFKKLSAGDTVAMQAYQASGAVLALDGSALGTFLDVTYIGQ